MVYINVPTWERAVRFAVGLALGAASVLLFDGLTLWLGLGSGVGLGLTAVFGWCPACALVGRKLDAKAKAGAQTYFSPGS